MLDAKKRIAIARLAQSGLASSPTPIDAGAQLTSTSVDMTVIGHLSRGGLRLVLQNASKPQPFGTAHRVGESSSYYSQFSSGLAMGKTSETRKQC